MATDLNANVNTVTSRRLWFGLLTTAIAWVSLGCIDILINWRACTHQEDYGIPPAQYGPRVLIGGIAVLLLIISFIAGLTSYRNWRHLSQQSLLEGEAVERHQFMAYIGVIISITLGMGILWLAIPPLFLDICWRAR
jgi:hypothetical protein